MEKLLDKTMIEAPENFVAQAVQEGTPQEVVLTPEQAATFCALKANAAPPTPSLVAAAARPRRFRVDAR